MMMIRIQATYPSGRVETLSAKTMSEAIALGNRLKDLGCEIEIKKAGGRR